MSDFLLALKGVSRNPPRRAPSKLSASCLFTILDPLDFIHYPVLCHHMILWQLVCLVSIVKWVLIGKQSYSDGDGDITGHSQTPKTPKPSHLNAIILFFFSLSKSFFIIMCNLHKQNLQNTYLIVQHYIGNCKKILSFCVFMYKMLDLYWWYKNHNTSCVMLA